MHATFATTYDPRVATLIIVGELDIESRGRLAWRLLELVALPCTTVRLDVGQMSYVDSSSLRLIDQAREKLEAGGTTVEITAFSRCFDLVSTVGGFAGLVAASGPAPSEVGPC